MHRGRKTSHSVRLVDVHVEVLDQILEGIHVPTFTNCMEGVNAEEVGIGQGLLKPFPLDVDALCDLLEAADVAVVGGDEEGRLRRPLVLVFAEDELEGVGQRHIVARHA